MEPQVWSEGRSFPGQVFIDGEGPALETAKSWRSRDTTWTDGSRLDNGEVGAACVWKRGEGWTGRRFHLGNYKEVFDAEVFAIYQTLKVCDNDQYSNHRYAVFSDSQSAIQCIRYDTLGPGQQWARAAIEICSRLVSRQNEVSILWIPTHAGVEGNEMADQFAKEAAGGQQHGSRRSSGGRPVFHTSHGSDGDSVRGHDPVDLGACQAREATQAACRTRPQKEGAETGQEVAGQSVLSATFRSRGNRLLPPRPDIRPAQKGFGPVPMVQMRQEGVAASRLHRVRGLDPPDPKAVGEGGQGRQVGASQGASGEEAVEGDGYGGGAGVFKRHPGRILVDGEGEGARGGGGRRIRRRGGRPGAALDFCGSAICTGNCTGFLFFCLFFCHPSILSIVWRGGKRGEGEVGVPVWHSEVGDGNGSCIENPAVDREGRIHTHTHTLWAVVFRVELCCSTLKGLKRNYDAVFCSKNSSINPIP